jgi:hypothetical protein
MPLSPQDAAQALREIETAQSRSATLRGYQHGAPHLFLWAVLWAVGYGATYLWPWRAGAIWAVIVGIGFAAGLAASRRGKAGASAWRFGAAFAALAAFTIATLTILRPSHGGQVAAFIPLVVATAYVLAGLWLGLRLAVAGIVLGLLTLLGYFLLRDYFLLWMAVVGSGALLVAGFWLRRA